MNTCSNIGHHETLRKKSHWQETNEHLRTTYPLKIMDDICGVAASKVWHRYADLFIVVVKIDTDVLLEFLSAP